MTAYRLAFCLLACAVSLGLLSCSGASSTLPEPDPPYYDWNCFQKHEGRYIYASESLHADKTGIDVSESQGQIDWQAVRADGIRFAFIRVGYRGSTEGHVYLDNYFDYNMRAAKEAGVERGVYFFSQATTVQEAQEEAAFTIEALAGASLDYPVVFDYEMRASGITSRVSGVSSELASEIAQSFCEAIEAAGYRAMLYGNGYDLDFYQADTLGKYPIWYAEYGALPGRTTEFGIWQYANNGSVNGIGTDVDLNLDMALNLETDRNEANESGTV